MEFDPFTKISQSMLIVERAQVCQNSVLFTHLGVRYDKLAASIKTPFMWRFGMLVIEVSV